MVKIKVKKIKYDYECQRCGIKPATLNLQGGGWILCEITKNGRFNKLKEWGQGEEENSFYCNECYEKEMS